MTTREKAIAIAPKFTSLASFLGSGFIIYEIAKDKKKMQTTFHRVLLGMCCCDLLSSAWFFVGTWGIPQGTEGVYGASGNFGTCVAQGFFSQLSLTTAMYNANLATFYLLQIRLGWTRDNIRTQAEPWLHLFALSIGLGTAIAAVPLNLYNNDYWECWIAPLPSDCRESWKHPGEDTNCVRGDNASLFRWLFYYGPLWAAIVYVTLCMFLVYRAVLHTERMSARYGSTGADKGSRRHKFSQKVAVQGFWYCGAFYATWILPTVTRLTQLFMGGDTPFWLICLTATFVPIQGALNFVVYVRPRYKKYPITQRMGRWIRRMKRKFKDGFHMSSRTIDGQSTVPYEMSKFSDKFYSSADKSAFSNHRSPAPSSHHREEQSVPSTEEGVSVRAMEAAPVMKRETFAANNGHWHQEEKLEEGDVEDAVVLVGVVRNGSFSEGCSVSVSTRDRDDTEEPSGGEGSETASSNRKVRFSLPSFRNMSSRLTSSKSSNHSSSLEPSGKGEQASESSSVSVSTRGGVASEEASSEDASEEASTGDAENGLLKNNSPEADRRAGGKGSGSKSPSSTRKIRFAMPSFRQTLSSRRTISKLSSSPEPPTKSAQSSEAAHSENVAE